MLATEHPERDEWVNERAAEECHRGGFPLAPYQGVALTAWGDPVHLFALDDDATRAREYWDKARAHLNSLSKPAP